MADQLDHEAWPGDAVFSPRAILEYMERKRREPEDSLSRDQKIARAHRAASLLGDSVLSEAFMDIKVAQYHVVEGAAVDPGDPDGTHVRLENAIRTVRVVNHVRSKLIAYLTIGEQAQADKLSEELNDGSTE